MVDISFPHRLIDEVEQKLLPKLKAEFEGKVSHSLGRVNNIRIISDFDEDNGRLYINLIGDGTSTYPTLNGYRQETWTYYLAGVPDDYPPSMWPEAILKLETEFRSQFGEKHSAMEIRFPHQDHEIELNKLVERLKAEYQGKWYNLAFPFKVTDVYYKWDSSVVVIDIIDSDDFYQQMAYTVPQSGQSTDEVIAILEEQFRKHLGVQLPGPKQAELSNKVAVDISFPEMGLTREQLFDFNIAIGMQLVGTKIYIASTVCEVIDLDLQLIDQIIHIKITYAKDDGWGEITRLYVSNDGKPDMIKVQIVNTINNWVDKYSPGEERQAAMEIKFPGYELEKLVRQELIPKLKNEFLNQPAEIEDMAFHQGWIKDIFFDFEGDIDPPACAIYITLEGGRVPRNYIASRLEHINKLDPRQALVALEEYFRKNINLLRR